MPMRPLLFFALVLSSFRVSAFAQERNRPPVDNYDVWSNPYPGVRYLRRTSTAPCTTHILEVDLLHDGLDVEVTGPEQRWTTVGETARDQGFAVALNGGFWHNYTTPGGMHVSNGESWPGTGDDTIYGYLAILDNGRAKIGLPEEIGNPDRVQQAVSGRPSLVRDGELDVEHIDPIGTANMRQPRTAVGVSRNGRRVWFLVTDGRREHSRGMTLYEVGRTLEELGAYRALNLDGGGSSTLFVEALGGIINAPSGSRWEEALGVGAQEGEPTGRRRTTRDGREIIHVRGVEREVLNAVGLRIHGAARSARGSSSPFALPPETPIDIPQMEVLPPRPPPIAIGRARERIVPVMGATLMILGFAIFRRRRRSRVVQESSRLKG